MEPFTFDQAVIAGLLFLLGLLIGMFLLASPRWKRRYKAERARTQELEREVERLGRENREHVSLRQAAERNPATGPLATTDRDRDGTPDAVDTRVSGTAHPHGPEVVTTRDWTPVRPGERRP